MRFFQRFRSIENVEMRTKSLNTAYISSTRNNTRWDKKSIIAMIYHSVPLFAGFCFRVTQIEALSGLFVGVVELTGGVTIVGTNEPDLGTSTETADNYYMHEFGHMLGAVSLVES